MHACIGPAAGLKSFLALLAFLAHAGLQVQRVAIPTADGVTLDAALVLPDGVPRGPAIVALHGCGGPFPTRDGSWAVELAHAGHIVLLPDSFGSRAMGSQCRVEHRGISPDGARRQDAIAAAIWLARQPDTPPGGVDLIGWSNGASTVLYTSATRADLPPALFRRFVASYPGCAAVLRRASWRPSAPLLILIGADDDWTPAPPCRELAARFPGQIEFIEYPGAYHDFDAPNQPVRVEHGMATARNHGTIHAGTNEPARQDALHRVPAFLDATK